MLISFLKPHLKVCVSPKKMRSKNINPHPDTTACRKIRVCQIALTYPLILKNVELTAFLINQSISLTDPQCYSMSSLISSHLVNGIVNCVKVRSISSLSKGRHGKASEGLLKR